MPGFETVGEAWVRIHADGSSLGNEVDRMLADQRGRFNRGGEDSAEDFLQGMRNRVKNDHVLTDELTRGVRSAGKRSEHAGELFGDDFLDGVRNTLRDGDFGDEAATRMAHTIRDDFREAFERGGLDADKLRAQLANLDHQQLTSQQRARETARIYDDWSRSIQRQVIGSNALNRAARESEQAFRRQNSTLRDLSNTNDRLEPSLNRLRTDMDQLRNDFRRGRIDEDQFRAGLSRLNRDSDALRNAFSGMRRDLQGVNDDLRRGAAPGAEDHYARLREELLRSGAGVRSLRNDLRRLGDDFDNGSVRGDRFSRSMFAVARGIDRVTGSARQGRGQFAVWTTAIALLGPAVGPLVGAASAALIGLGGAAGTAAIGVYGIIQAMKSGSGIGQQYSKAFGSINSELQTLGAIAAKGLFDGINSGIQRAAQLFPTLNRAMVGLSQQMGTIAGNVGAGLLSLFAQMLPLIERFSASLVRGSGNFANWASNSGNFKDFLSYAEQQLPQVLQLLGAFARAFVSLVQATAPIGSVIVKGLTVLFNAITWLGTNAPQLLAAFWAAFAISRFIGLISGLVGVAVAIARMGTAMRALTLTAGIVGIIALIGGAIATFSGQSAKGTEQAQKFKSSLDEVTQALKDSGGAVTGSVIEKLTQASELSGVPELLAAIGKNMGDIGVYSANAAKAVGGTQAQFESFRKTVAATASTPLIRDISLKQLDAMRKSVLEGKAAAEADKAAQAELARQYAAANPEIARQATALGATIPAMQKASAAAQQQADQAKQAALAMQLENDAAGLLKNGLDALNGKSLSAAQAETQFQQTLETTNSVLRKNVKAGADYTKGGLANRSAVEQQIASARQLAQAVADQTGSTEKGTAAYNKHGQAILDTIAKDRGLSTATERNRDAVYRYAASLLRIGQLKVKPTILDVDIAQAQGNVGKLQQLIKDIKAGKIKGLDVDSDRARAAIARIQDEIKNIQHPSPIQLAVNNTPVFTSTEQAQKWINDVSQKKIPGLAANPQGTKVSTAIAQDFINRVKQYHVPGLDLNNAPGRTRAAVLQSVINDIKQGHIPGLDANSAPGRAEVARLQDAMGTLKDKTVTVTIDGMVSPQMAALYNKYANVGRQYSQGNYMAGGIVTSPTFATLGEKGYREAVIPMDIPLSRVNSDVRDMAALLRGQRGGGTTVAGGRTQNITLNVYPQAADPEAVSTSVLNRLTQMGR